MVFASMFSFADSAFCEIHMVVCSSSLLNIPLNEKCHNISILLLMDICGVSKLDLL